jgi:hypothetical protein
MAKPQTWIGPGTPIESSLPSTAIASPSMLLYVFVITARDGNLFHSTIVSLTVH